jgi:hypothetical protein
MEASRDVITLDGADGCLAIGARPPRPRSSAESSTRCTETMPLARSAVMINALQT